MTTDKLAAAHCLSWYVWNVVNKLHADIYGVANWRVCFVCLCVCNVHVHRHTNLTHLTRCSSMQQLHTLLQLLCYYTLAIYVSSYWPLNFGGPISQFHIWSNIDNNYRYTICTSDVQSGSQFSIVWFRMSERRCVLLSFCTSYDRSHCIPQSEHFPCPFRFVAFFFFLDRLAVTLKWPCD